jgi:DNA mismatch repair protein MutS2
MEKMDHLKSTNENLYQLELPLLINKMKQLVSTQYGMEHLEQISFLHDRKLLEEKLSEVSEMVDLMSGGNDIPVVQVKDIRSALEKTRPSDAFLEASDLIQIRENLVALEGIKRFIKTHQESLPHIRRYGDRIHAHNSLVNQINSTIDRKGDIRDDASPELRRIRREIHQLEASQKSVLMKVLKRYSDFSQDDIVTLRDGRLVLGIQHQFVNKINGIVHGTSGTGATVFIEPMETLRLSNQIQNLKIEQRKEIVRILQFLTGLIREVRDDIYYAVDNYGILDFIYAKARLAVKLKASTPKISDRYHLKLIKARHPLLLLKEEVTEVVPVDIYLGEKFKTLIITGPNAGGKTVALKTVGLLTVMTQMGLPIPAHPDSVIPTFDNILVDIGDRQDLEQNLSTFSAHIIRLNEILNQANHHSLVLIDEIGTGTDPREGSALAIALIRELTRRNTLTVATTHHGELKVFAYQTEGIENASMEFNMDTLQPTYRLQTGIPGSSYAFEIARRYGFEEPVLKLAEEILGPDKGALEKLLLDLNLRLQKAEKEEKALNIKLTETEGLKNLYQGELKRLQNQRRQLNREAAEEARQIISRANAKIEKLVADIRESQAGKAEIRKAHQELEKLRREADEIIEDTRTEQPSEDIQAGDAVWIENLREEGELISDPDSENKAWVLVNDMRMQLPVTHMKKLPGRQVESKKVFRTSDRSTAELEHGVWPELDLRGMDSFEAMESTNRYLDRALEYGWDEIRIVHGKGTGILRRKINEYLSKDPRVLEKRLGKWGEGDTGVTIVQLKKENR